MHIAYCPLRSLGLICFADIRVYNESLVYNASCLEGVIDKSAASGAELVNPDAIKACGTGYDDTRQVIFFSRNGNIHHIKPLLEVTPYDKASKSY